MREYRYAPWNLMVSLILGEIGELFLNLAFSDAKLYWYDECGNFWAFNTPDGLNSEYIYGPFGELLRATGPLAKINPFRFSTKYTDDETDLVYYGYRYYNPSTGRWLSRDPMEEWSGLNLNSFVRNDPCDYLDSDGRQTYMPYPNPHYISDPPPPPPNPSWPTNQPAPASAARKATYSANAGAACLYMSSVNWVLTIFDASGKPVAQGNKNIDEQVDMTGSLHAYKIFSPNTARKASTPSFRDDDLWQFYAADGWATFKHTIHVENGSGPGWTFVFTTTLNASGTPSYTGTTNATAQ